MSKRIRSKANIPIHRESIFWILSPVSRLLPKPPILPRLPRIHESIMQNKPNFLKAKTTATLFVKKDYENIPPLPHSRKQTQSNPIPQRDMQYEIRDTRYEPKSPRPKVAPPAERQHKT